ncbi:Maf family nucleotide pyrophosphatase [Odoribacter sp. OttesenSCG-928-J03]|nr:Maf family nucleotide pyrophosphatase [Odoribacter sp. OttesenSCG-928-J03]
MKYKFILGSNSLRRQQLLRDLGLTFELRVKETEEIYPPDLPVAAVPEYLAKVKAEALMEDMKGDELLITADTVVILENEVIGKPEDRTDAIRILGMLSGKKHTVVTGVCLTTKEKQEVFSVKTDVYFSRLRKEDIVYYVDNYHPFDKAGGYGIQEWIGYIGIKKINGSFYNVMGLPVQALFEKLKSF